MLPRGDLVADSRQEDTAVAWDLGCSLEAAAEAAELRAKWGLDKLKCLEEGEDPEVIPENTDLVTLGYGGLCHLFKYFFQHCIIQKSTVWYCYHSIH